MTLPPRTPGWRSTRPRQLGPILRRRRVLRLPHLDSEAVRTIVDHRLDVRLLARLGGQHEGGDEWNVHVRKRRVRTLHRPSPQPGDHGQLLADQGLQVAAFPGHLGGDLDLGVEMTNALLCLVTHPPAAPEQLVEPKQRMVDLARQSRRPQIRADMVPRAGSGRAVGPAYTSRLIEFVTDRQRGWRPDVAAARCDSLARCIRHLGQVAARWAEGRR
jgi:hypothetical protein